MNWFIKRKFDILRISISVGFICLLLWMTRGKLSDVVNVLKRTNLWLFLTALLLYILEIIVLSGRLKLVFYKQNIIFPLKDVSYLTFIGLFFNNFLPTSIGGDVVKAYYTSKRSNDKRGSIASIFIDRVFGLFTFIGIALVVLIFIKKTPEHMELIWMLWFILFLSLFVVFLLSNRKLINLISNIFNRFFCSDIKDKLIKVHKCFLIYFKNKSVLFAILAISLGAQAMGIIAIYILAKGLYLDISLLILFLTLPIVFTISMIPSLGGLGVRESAFVFCLKDFIGAENAFALSLSFLTILLGSGLIGGVLFLLNKGHGEKIGNKTKHKGKPR